MEDNCHVGSRKNLFFSFPNAMLLCDMAVLSLLLKILVTATLETAQIHCCVQGLSEVFALIIAHEIMAPTG